MGCERKWKEVEAAVDQDHGQNQDLDLHEDTTTTDGVDPEPTVQGQEAVLEATVIAHADITITGRHTSNPSIEGMTWEFQTDMDINGKSHIPLLQANPENMGILPRSTDMTAAIITGIDGNDHVLLKGHIKANITAVVILDTVDTDAELSITYKANRNNLLDMDSCHCDFLINYIKRHLTGCWFSFILYFLHIIPWQYISYGIMVWWHWSRFMY